MFTRFVRKINEMSCHGLNGWPSSGCHGSKSNDESCHGNGFGHCGTSSNKSDSCHGSSSENGGHC